MVSEVQADDEPRLKRSRNKRGTALEADKVNAKSRVGF